MSDFLQLLVTHPAYDYLCIFFPPHSHFGALHTRILERVKIFLLFSWLYLTFRTGSHNFFCRPCFIFIWLICIYVCIFGSFTSLRTACGLRSVPRFPSGKKRQSYDKILLLMTMVQGVKIRMYKKGGKQKVMTRFFCLKLWSLPKCRFVLMLRCINLTKVVRGLRGRCYRGVWMWKINMGVELIHSNQFWRWNMLDE